MELDFAIDRSGRIDPTHAARYKEFGDWISACYSDPLGQSMDFVNSTVVEVIMPGASSGGTFVDRVMLMEDLRYGQRVLSYKVETLHAVGNDGQIAWPGKWVHFSNGTAIGHKHIDIVPQAIGVDKHSRFRLTVTASAAVPVIRLLVFKPYGCLPIVK